MEPEDIENIVNDMGRIVNLDDFEMNIDEGRNMIDFYQIKEYRKDEYSQMKSYLEGISILINPCDGKMCGINYFETTTEKYERGNHGAVMSANGFLVPSLYSQKHFPQVCEFMQKIKESMDMSKLDGYAYNKNYYILLCETAKRDKKYIYTNFLQIKHSDLTDNIGCSYKYVDELHEKDYIRFRIHGETDKVYAVGNMLEYKGHFYHTGKEFLEAYKRGISYDDLWYGQDETFIAYINNNKEIEIYDNTKAEFEEPEEERIG